jgi:hypothetical protein
MGKLLVLAVILLQFAGLTDDVCALCVPWVQADGLAVGDEMLSDNQGRPARAKVVVSPPDRTAQKPPLAPLEIRAAVAADPGGVRATDPIYSYMSLQR